MAATIAFGTASTGRMCAGWCTPTRPPAESWYQRSAAPGATACPLAPCCSTRAADIALARHRIEQSPAPEEQKAHRAGTPRGNGGDRRGRDLPPASAAALLRRSRRAGVRQLRHLPLAAAAVRRHGGGAEAAVGHPAHGPALRPGAHRGRAARAADGDGGRTRARPAAYLRVGADLPDRTWRDIARQLVARGALDVAVESRGELLPTEAARPILKGEETLWLRERGAALARPGRPCPPPQQRGQRQGCSRHCAPGAGRRRRNKACRPI